MQVSRIPRRRCSEDGCNYPVFSKGLCKHHAAKNYTYKGVKTKSTKRNDIEKRYRMECTRVDKEYTRNGEVHCFFCQLPIHGNIDHHHVAGRTGELMFNGIIPAHPQCHLALYPGGFHGLTLSQMAKAPWIHRYMVVVRDTDQSKYFILYHKLKEHGYEDNSE